VDKSTQLSNRPAISGPMMAPNCITVMFSEFAAANWSPGSIREMAAERAGAFTA
jgi:hypothetical protein